MEENSPRQYPESAMVRGVRDMLVRIQRNFEHKMQSILIGKSGALPEHFRPRVDIYQLTDDFSRDYILEITMWANIKGKHWKIASTQETVTRQQLEGLCRISGGGMFEQVDVVKFVSERYGWLWNQMFEMLVVEGLSAVANRSIPKDEFKEPENERESEPTYKGEAEPGPQRDEEEDATLNLPFGEFGSFSSAP